MSRTKYSVSFPSKRAGAEITWPNTVLVFPDRDARQPLQEAYLENPSSPVLLWSESASVPFSCEGETLTCTTGAPTQTGADAAAAGGASEQLGDYARWEATGGFDYTTIAAHSGTSVTFDNSTDWLNNWGSPAAVVTEAGTYSLSLATKSAAQAGNDYLALALMDPTGADSRPVRRVQRRRQPDAVACC